MISEQYWQLIRRWFWLIGIFAAAGAALAVFGLPYVLGSTSSYNASSTIAVAHYVSPTRIVATGQGDRGDTVVSDYTKALALYATTPQYYAAVQRELAKSGISMPFTAIRSRLRIDASPELFRIDVTGTGGTGASTGALVTAGTNVLVARAEDEESRVAFGLVANIDKQRQDLVSRLDDLSQRRQDLLGREIAAAGPALANRGEVTRLANDTDLLTTGGQALTDEMRGLITTISQILGDPDLIDIDVEITSVQKQLADLTTNREQVLSSRVYSAPLQIINPTETVETQAASLPARDLGVLGGALGLIAGWAVANLFDRLLGKRRDPAPAPLRVVIAESEEDGRLRRLIERSAEVERRAQALATAVGGSNGREASMAGRRLEYL